MRNDSTVPRWPSHPSDVPGAPLVRIGRSFVESARDHLLSTLDSFLTVYAARPSAHNVCGVRFNHAFAIWLVVQKLRPTTIIESGINAGASTYFFRAAAGPHVRIISLDPLDTPICGQTNRWVGSGGRHTYLTGKNFRDVANVNWSAWEPRLDLSTTLFYQDDHQPATSRVETLLRHGIRHAMLEDVRDRRSNWRRITAHLAQSPFD